MSVENVDITSFLDVADDVDNDNPPALVNFFSTKENASAVLDNIEEDDPLPDPPKKEEDEPAKTPEEIKADEEAKKAADEEAKRLAKENGTFDELDFANDDDDPDLDDPEKKKVSKTSSAISSLIEKGVLLPFDEDKDISDYTDEEVTELIETNFETRKEELKNQVSTEFFEALPAELQNAMSYVANGGTDLGGFLSKVSSDISVSEMSPDKDADAILRKYLNDTEFGTSDEVSEQIQEWKDLGVLKKKAQSFHPKLVAKQKAKRDKDIADAEAEKNKTAEFANAYKTSVIEVLQKDDLNGIPLTSEMRNSLAQGLLTSSYDSKFSKGKTNQLYHLIEKYQTDDKRSDLVAEALYLLQDPEAYRAAISKKSVKEHDQTTLRKLKTEEGLKKGGSNNIDPKDTTRTRKTIKRRKNNFFDA